MKRLVLLLAAFGLAACVRSVPIVEAREQFAEVHQEAKTRAADALKQAKRSDRLVRRMTELMDNRQREPLPELRRLSAAMQASAQSLKARARAIQKVRTRLAKLGRNRTELRAGETGWKLYQTLRADLSRLDANSRSAYRNFSEQPQAFDALCKTHKIGPMDTKGYGDRMGAKIKAMDGWVNEATARLERVDYLLKEEGISPDDLRAVQAASVQLQAMTDTRAEVRRTALRFRLETKPGAEAIIAPGMVTYDLFERLDHLGADIEVSGKRIKKLTKDLPGQGD